jgi:lipopolysaccharide export system permease protein
VKTLHLYLLRQVLVTLVMTVLVFTFVLVLGNVLKEVLGLLVNGRAPVGIVLQAVGLLVPLVVIYALPMGMLTAVLLVFGRFSADQELTAARAGGISLVSLTAPILILSLALCGLSAWTNMHLAPQSRLAYKSLLVQFTRSFSAAQLPEGRHIKDIDGYVIYLGRNLGMEMRDVMIYRLDQGSNPPMTLLAQRATIESLPGGTNVLNLFDVQMVAVQGGQANVSVSKQFQIAYDPSVLEKAFTPSIRNMSFRELRAELQSVQKRLQGAAGTGQDAEREKFVAKQVADLVTPIRVQMHRQVAFSFACFGFTLVGIPLGIRVQRRETNIGFAMALVLVLIYYALVLLGLSLDNHPEAYPHLLLWVPNVVFQGVGAVLLWRANRGL